MAMAQGIQNLKDDIEHNLHKDDLRADLCILLEELKQIGSYMVAEIERFMDATSAQPALDQIPNLQGWIWRAEKGKVELNVSEILWIPFASQHWFLQLLI